MIKLFYLQSIGIYLNSLNIVFLLAEILCGILPCVFDHCIYMLFLKSWIKENCIFQSVKADIFNYNWNDNTSFKMQAFGCLLPSSFMCHLYYLTEAEISYIGNNDVLRMILWEGFSRTEQNADLLCSYLPPARFHTFTYRSHDKVDKNPLFFCP